MLPTNLSPLEVIDAGIHSETLAFKMYDRLARRVEVPTLAGCSRLRLAPREGDGSASIAEVELVGP